MQKNKKYSLKELKKITTELLETVKSDYTVDSNVVEYLDDGSIKQLFLDFGDYVPFFLYFGEKKFSQKQLNGLYSFLTKDYLLPPRLKLLGLGYNDLYEHSDLILGLVDYTALTKKKKPLQLAEKVYSQLRKKIPFVQARSSYYFPQFGIALPLFDSKDGMFIELLVEMYRATKKHDYLDDAKVLAKNMIQLLSKQNDNLYRHLYSPVPFIYPSSIRQNLQTTLLMKSNTNTVFGFLELYKETKDETLKKSLDQWHESLVKRMMFKSGGIAGRLIDGHRKNKKEIDLTSNFSVLDALCDMVYFLEDKKYLNTAQKLADYWLSKQSKKTGLFPLHPERKLQASYLDSETDMCIALNKLAQLTKKKKYATAADKVFAGIIEYHRMEKGYILEVDINSTEVVTPHVKTKFMCLFLKALLFYQHPDKDKLYRSPELFNLLKDR